MKEVTFKQLLKEKGKDLKKYIKEHEKDRLDLFYRYDDKKITIVELKRPCLTIKVKALSQLIGYRYIIKTQFHNRKIYSFLLGSCFEEPIDDLAKDFEKIHIYIRTFKDMISIRRKDIEEFESMLGKVNNVNILDYISK